MYWPPLSALAQLGRALPPRPWVEPAEHLLAVAIIIVWETEGLHYPKTVLRGIDVAWN